MMTPKEREAFDALLRYAEMEEDHWTLDPSEFRKKYGSALPGWVRHEACRLALEKAREIVEKEQIVDKKKCLVAIQWTGENQEEIYKMAMTANYDLRCIDEGRVDVVVDGEIVKTAFIGDYIVADGECPTVCSKSWFKENYQESS